MGSLNDFFILRNGVKIPKIGFGTAPLKGVDAYQAVQDAIKTGYRHIDTAANYKNEVEVGRAVKASNLPREAFFITSKLDAKIKTTEGAREAFFESLENLNTDYLDLYLIHAPWPWEEKFSDHSEGNVAAFKALEKLQSEGKIKAIGVSNFSPNDLENIRMHCDSMPLVNQIKYHIGHPQKETVDYCEKHAILVEAYSPLGRGKILDHDTITTLAKKYNVSPSQLCIRYPIEKGILPLPRSSKPHHIKTNAAIDFTITASDLLLLDDLIIDSIEFGTPVKKSK